MNSREKLADVLIVYSISRLSHLVYLFSTYINIFINTFPAYNATSHISTQLVPMTSKRHEWQQQCFILCSTPQFTRLSQWPYFVCFHTPNSCKSWTPGKLVVLLAHRELFHISASSLVSLRQYCPSHFVHHVNAYSCLKTHFRSGTLCVSAGS